MLEKYVESLTKKLAQVEASTTSNCSNTSTSHNMSCHQAEADKEMYKSLLKKYMALESIHTSVKAENAFYKKTLKDLMS